MGVRGEIAASVLNRLIVGNAKVVEYEITLMRRVRGRAGAPGRSLEDAAPRLAFLRQNGSTICTGHGVFADGIMIELLFTRSTIRDLFVSTGFTPRSIAPLLGKTRRK